MRSQITTARTVNYRWLASSVPRPPELSQDVGLGDYSVSPPPKRKRLDSTNPVLLPATAHWHLRQHEHLLMRAFGFQPAHAPTKITPTVR
jgi:hypothetical protein